MDTREIKNSIRAGWDAMSPSYQADSRIALDDVHYAPFAPGERYYGLMGDVSGKRILELACGRRSELHRPRQLGRRDCRGGLFSESASLCSVAGGGIQELNSSW